MATRKETRFLIPRQFFSVCDRYIRGSVKASRTKQPSIQIINHSASQPLASDPITL